MLGGTAIEIDKTPLTDVMLRIAAIGKTDYSDVLQVIGALVETQTRQRMEEDRTAPDGKAWQPWSAEYARTRHSNHNLLQSEGHLVDSIQYVVDKYVVAVGSNVEYAADHQLGDPDRGLPARTYLGLSDGNMQELEDELNSWANKMIGNS